MAWMMLAIAAAVAMGAVVVLRGGRQSGRAVHRQRSHAERIERPRRRLAQFHTSGVPPRWDP